MRDDEIAGRLREVNPWWRLSSGGEDPRRWSASDRVLLDRARYDLGYRSAILADVASGPADDKLVVLRGPRRVGKSVVLKETILALCGRDDLDPRQIVFLPADGMRGRDLHRVVVLGRELTRSVDLDGAKHRIWLLDEVTGLDGWTTTLKYLRDNTPFGDDTVVCTGSSWNDSADAEKDLLAGRAGSAPSRRTRLLLPMRFRDFLAATRPELPRPDAVPPWDLQGARAQRTATHAELFAGDLDLAWQAYLSSGGYPRAVAEHTKLGAVSESFLSDLAAWLHRDVDRDAPVESIPRLLAGLAARSAAPLNRAAAAADLGYANRPTFDLRLNRLVRSFGALWCHQVDQRGSRVAGAQSKLYLADSLLSWLGHYLRAGMPAPEMTMLTEAALGTALAAAIEDLQAGRWMTEDTIGYVRTPGGSEIDFGSIPIPGAGATIRTTPIESKWVEHGWRAEARAIEVRFKGGVVATKNVTDLSHPAWAMPAPVLALLLG
jgi:predicted AAA+ superfamily ATPase